MTCIHEARPVDEHNCATGSPARETLVYGSRRTRLGDTELVAPQNTLPVHATPITFDTPPAVSVFCSLIVFVCPNDQRGRITHTQPTIYR